jgi:hypothetical protein
MRTEVEPLAKSRNETKRGLQAAARHFCKVAEPGARSWLPLRCFEEPERKPWLAPAGTTRRLPIRETGSERPGLIVASRPGDDEVERPMSRAFVAERVVAHRFAPIEVSPLLRGFGEPVAEVEVVLPLRRGRISESLGRAAAAVASTVGRDGQRRITVRWLANR